MIRSSDTGLGVTSEKTGTPYWKTIWSFRFSSVFQYLIQEVFCDANTESDYMSFIKRRDSLIWYRVSSYHPRGLLRKNWRKLKKEYTPKGAEELIP